jgi:hypothetical protein
MTCWPSRFLAYPLRKREATFGAHLLLRKAGAFCVRDDMKRAPPYAHGGAQGDVPRAVRILR